jgi:hypothetical protein
MVAAMPSTAACRLRTQTPKKATPVAISGVHGATARDGRRHVVDPKDLCAPKLLTVPPAIGPDVGDRSHNEGGDVDAVDPWPLATASAKQANRKPEACMACTWRKWANFNDDHDYVDACLVERLGR